jgi:hypothetical protein
MRVTPTRIKDFDIYQSGTTMFKFDINTRNRCVIQVIRFNSIFNI